MNEPLRPAAVRLMDVMVTRVRDLTPRVREFWLARPDGQPLPAAEAGAHVELHFRAGDQPLIRRYSLVRGMDEARDYRIAVQREPHAGGSAHIHEHFAVGTTLQASHPRCDFFLDRRDTHSLLVAGGIGITPLLSMALSLQRRGRPFSLFYAGRTLADMAYVPEIRDQLGASAQLHAQDAAGSAPDLKALLAAQPPGTTVYACGPVGMVRALRDAARDLGWDEGRVRSELFGPAPIAQPEPFTLRLARSGQTLAVGPHTSILEAMMAAGLQPLFDCGRGECGLCMLSVEQAEGELLHRDSYLSTEQKSAGTALCICVSRLRGKTLTLAA